MGLYPKDLRLEYYSWNDQFRGMEGKRPYRREGLLMPSCYHCLRRAELPDEWMKAELERWSPARGPYRYGELWQEIRADPEGDLAWDMNSEVAQVQREAFPEEPSSDHLIPWPHPHRLEYRQVKWRRASARRSLRHDMRAKIARRGIPKAVSSHRVASTFYKGFRPQCNRRA